jgi:hypothetical protein
MVVRPRMVGGLFCNFKPTRCTADIQTARTPDSLIALYMTPGVQALYQTQAIAARVQAYDDFTERNDPYGEHDFGSFEFCGETIFWKIEYYDLDFQMLSLDPSDPNITSRVLTIMLGHEY